MNLGKLFFLERKGYNYPMPKTILSCKNISYSYGEDEILHDISFSIASGQVLALVGSNGVGKTTLLKILLGKIKPDSGSVTLAKNVNIAYIPQEIAIEDINKKVGEYLVNVQQFELAILNLPFDILDRNISTLSGGEKSKINLLKLNQIESDLYVLDEPTNNLDAHALDFLENVIKKNRNKASFIIVSHDRQLLENTTDKIIEIDSHTRSSETYPGPFSNYITLRKKKIENMWKEYSDYLETKRKLEASLQEKKQWSVEGDKGPKIVDKDKFARGIVRDWSTSILGKSVKNAQEKLDTLEKVEKPKETVAVNYSIEAENRSGDIVFDLAGVEKTLGNKKIGPIDLNIQYGDILAILGDNGSGKTTLLKMLMDKITPDSGTIRKGSGLNIGYLPQESEIDDKSVLEKVKEISGENESEFRKLLHHLGITKDEMKKSKKELSPGERSRFVLALLIAQKPNCLILDEPTNHLDIYALDFLEEAIKTYEGTVIIVTHDRYFLSRIGEYRRYEM